MHNGGLAAGHAQNVGSCITAVWSFCLLPSIGHTVSRVESIPKSQAFSVRPRVCSVAYLEGLRNDPPEFRRVWVSLHGVGFPGASLANRMVGQTRCSRTCISRGLLALDPNRSVSRGAGGGKQERRTRCTIKRPQKTV